SAATVVLPTESVVLISMSCLKMSCAMSCAIRLGASFVCASIGAAITRHTKTAKARNFRDVIGSPEFKKIGDYQSERGMPTLARFACWGTEKPVRVKLDERVL